jgi:hypothetical protein
VALLVARCGWTPAEYERWLFGTSCAQPLARGRENETRRPAGERAPPDLRPSSSGLGMANGVARAADGTILASNDLGTHIDRVDRLGWDGDVTDC